MLVFSVFSRSELSQQKIKQALYCSLLSDLKFYTRFIIGGVYEGYRRPLYDNLRPDRNLSKFWTNVLCNTLNSMLLHAPVVTSLFYTLICAEECINEVLHFAVFCNLLAVSPLWFQNQSLFVLFIRCLGCWDPVCYLRIFWSGRDGDGDRVYRYGLGVSGIKSWWGRDFPISPDQPWGPLSPVKGIPGLLQRIAAGGWRRSPRPHLAPG